MYKQLFFPNEEAASAVFFSDFQSDHSISLAPQQDLQAFLDQSLVTDLCHSRSDLLDCSFPLLWYQQWLAFPQLCLGLAIPGPEFVENLRLWLRVTIFPQSPLCTCLSGFSGVSPAFEHA